MPILNYTTKVPVEQTINDLQKILAKAKASAIMTEYANGLPSGLSFRVNVNGKDIHFTLPVKVDGVAAALKRDRQYRDEGHARRVAWRIVKDWCDSQMALIDAGQAELAQVFLPYAQAPNGETFYQAIKGKGFLQLTGPKHDAA
jgi:hypothetical protein